VLKKVSRWGGGTEFNERDESDTFLKWVPDPSNPEVLDLLQGILLHGDHGTIKQLYVD